MTKPLRIDGVDISHWQGGDLDFRAAKRAGVKFVYHKASENTHYEDPMYDRRRREAAKAGIPFGAYHFARPESRRDAKAEARWFIEHAQPKPGDLRPVLDLETLEHMSGMPLVRWADDFCAEVKRLIGVVPICYTPYELSTELEETSLMWRPRYNDRNEPPEFPYDIWQFSNGKYGVPNKVAGFGHVDLNHMRDGLDIEDMMIPEEEHEQKKTIREIAREVIDGKWGNGRVRVKRLRSAGYNPKRVQAKVNDLLAPEPEPAPEPKGKPARLRFAHCSLQFSDTPAQHTDDIERLFKRGYDVLTGTEAGPGANNTLRELRRCARKYGYRLSITHRYDTWVAVKGSLVVSDYDEGAEFALWRSSRTPGDQPGRWGDKGVVWASWNMGPTYGEFAVGAVHNLTHGGAGKEWKRKSDEIYARVMGEWAAEHGRGKRLAFIGGDFNLVDKRNDVFKGHPLTTCWDDLKRWPGTGHGNIDAIARYDRDGRVRCVGARSLNDRQVFLNTDHFLIEAEYEIQPLD